MADSSRQLDPTGRDRTVQQVVVDKSEISHPTVREHPLPSLRDGEVRVSVDRFGLTSNNVTYAVFGDALGYWLHFPVADDAGCVPVWGFAEIAESRHPDLDVGERVFGYLPMASELVIAPDDVGPLVFSDGIEHRASLHPWYTRFYRCGGDPVYDAAQEPVQAVMWALFMTGWALAEQLSTTVTDVVISSASSKTALSLAWSLGHRPESIRVIGVTSPGNRGFFEGSGVFDDVTTYDALDLWGVTGPASYVDTAGSPAITARIHEQLGDRLVDSVVLGATHRGAGGPAGELVGPTPRLFFIPDVAEQLADTESHAAFHDRFATAWSDFVAWTATWLQVEQSSGADAIVAAYQRAHAGEIGPERAAVVSW